MLGVRRVETENALQRVNVGCGLTPTAGWINFDNSPALRLPVPLLKLMTVAGLASQESLKFSEAAPRLGIRRAVAWRLPLRNGSVGVVYSSHMLEHLEPVEARLFLREVRRVLNPGGVLRLAVPDLLKLVQDYLASGDADGFVSRTRLASPSYRTPRSRLRVIVAGARHHLWMYDGRSLGALLRAEGFVSPHELPPGETLIPNPAPLDLRERESESVYVEAFQPGGHTTSTQ
jgi:predicted SAM-dependent methyltransferase